MKTPTISAVVPCYNTANYLKLCLNSLTNQSLPPSEIIVVDDGSTDNPQKITAKYPNVKLVRHPKNLGSNAARATGVIHSKSNFIFIAESDAVYEPNCLEELWRALKKNPKRSYSYCSFKFIDQKSKKEKVIKSGIFSRRRLTKESYISWVSLTKKKDFLMPDCTIKRFNDWDHWLAMMEKGKTGVFVNKFLFKAFLRPGGISSGGDFDREYWRLTVEKKHKIGPKVAIYTFTRDRINYTKRTFVGMKKLGYPFHHYILDNGSIDGSQAWLRSYKKTSQYEVSLTLKNENIGIAEGKNVLLPRLVKKYDYILKLDNDCEIVSADILFNLIVLCRILKNNAVLSPKVDGLIRPVPRYAYMKIGPHVLSPVPLVGGIFCFAPSKFYFDFRSNRLFKIAKGDPEFADHVWKNKGRIYYVDDLKVVHMETSTGQAIRYPGYFRRRNLELDYQLQKMQKTGFKPQFRLKNSAYWNEVYQIDGNLKFKLLSLLSRFGFRLWYPLISRLANNIENR